MSALQMVSHSDPWDGQMRARIPVKLSNEVSIAATIDPEASLVWVDRGMFLSTDEEFEPAAVTAEGCDGHGLDVVGCGKMNLKIDGQKEDRESDCHARPSL
uniref:Uncharacterized protein n=1 Tax=Rhodosorus marinus TaxID=101924 RepID=A0A6T6L421_9RHOD|mmetsp:Transcript_14579/g.21289  ORF Transcript_14579/g.21289 Transcript_14579/m.21289 type:complete len:101 (+) Transcript_14579:321-623(+)